MTLLTENQIEIHVERRVDALDSRLMRDELTDEQYRSEYREIKAWAERQYSKVRVRS